MPYAHLLSLMLYVCRHSSASVVCEFRSCEKTTVLVNAAVPPHIPFNEEFTNLGTYGNTQHREDSSTTYVDSYDTFSAYQE